jgi:RimJ/RimL family protein N-acetyltransferase
MFSPVVGPPICTERLLLRPWRDEDLAPFAALNADAEVMEHYPRVLSREESDAVAARLRKHFADNGFGLWAVEVRGGAPFVGFVGMQRVPFDAHFTPAVEVGWRLARSVWSRGYATEGARAALDRGFNELGLDEIVAMTVPANARSRRVMERLGMVRRDDDDFDHPRLPEDHPLRRHVLYRMLRSAWGRPSTPPA